MSFTGQEGTTSSRLGNIQLGKGLSAPALPSGVASAPSQGGLIPILAYRILDPFGNEKIRYLPHLHKSKWTVRGLMPGQNGSSVVGNFDIPLHVPGTPEWMKAREAYQFLDINYRVEGYLGDVIAGDPRVTGIIRELPAEFNNFTIRGIDSIGLLQFKNTGRTESFNGRTDTLAQYSLKAYTGQLLDDFSGTLSTWTNPASYTITTNPNGLAAIKPGAGGDGQIYSTATFGTALYADCYIDAWFYAACSNVAGQQAEMAITAAVHDTNNLVLGRAEMRRVTSSRFEIDAEIWTKTAGTWTLQIRKPSVIVVSSPVALVKVTLRGYNNSSTSGVYTWEVLLNGAASGCIFQYVNAPYGSVGVRSTLGTIYASNFVFVAKQNVFNAGNFVAGSKFINQTFSNTPLLDVLCTAATTEGYLWRKNPKANIDTIDFGPSIGTDYTSRITFVEGRNLEATSSREPNAEPVITVGRLLGSPGQDNTGFLEWVNIPAANKYGLYYDTVQTAPLADIGAQQAFIAKIVALRSNPGQAKKLTVLRDTETADVWRELDFVSTTSSRLSMTSQSVQVMGWTLQEGDPKQEIIGDQYPKDLMVADIRKLRQQLDALSAGIDDVTPSSSSGIVYDSRYGSPSIIQYTGGYQSVTAAANYRLKFSLPNNVAAIQKIYLNLTLTSSAVGTGNTGTGTSHTHASTSTGAETGHTHSHAHTISLSTYGATVVPIVKWLSSGTPQLGTDDVATHTDTTSVNSNAQGSSGHTHAAGGTVGTEAAHTHSIAGGSNSWATGALLSYGPLGSSFPVGGATNSLSLSGFGPYNTGSTDQDFTNIDLTSALTGNANNPIGGGQWELDISSTLTGGIMASLVIIGIVKSL